MCDSYIAGVLEPRAGQQGGEVLVRGDQAGEAVKARKQQALV
jgi:hypothetical protein